MRTTPVAGIAAAALTLLLAGGTAIALTSGDSPAVALPTIAAASASAGPTGHAAAEPAQLSAGEAAAIALARVGGGTVTGIERETEHGRAEWKVEITDGSTEHDVRVDAVTGAITRAEVRSRSGGDVRSDNRSGSSGRGSDDARSDDRGRSPDDGPGHDVGDDKGGAR